MDVFGVCLSTFLLAKRVWSEWHSKWSGAISYHAGWLGLAPEALGAVGRQSQVPGQALLLQRCLQSPIRPIQGTGLSCCALPALGTLSTAGWL